MLLAMQDEEFQDILQNDKILDELEKEKFNPEDEYFELMMIFSGELQYNHLVLNTLTLGMWAYLYSIRSAFTLAEEPTNKDIDIVMYLLHNGYHGVSDNIYEDSFCFCEKNNIEYENAKKFIYRIIFISFRAMEMLPSMYSTGEKCRYNLEWVTSILKMVCNAVNADRDYVLYRMSLTECFYHVINVLKENDTKNLIRRRNSDEINAEIYKRTMMLGEEYFKQKYGAK